MQRLLPLGVDGRDGHDRYGEQDDYDDQISQNSKEIKTHQRCRHSRRKGPTIQAFATPIVATIININAYDMVDSD